MNHLYPFLVTLELLPIVVETASTSGDGRILFVSSSGHVRNVTGPVNFETIDSDLDYGRLKSYGRTKLYNVSLLYILFGLTVYNTFCLLFPGDDDLCPPA